MKLEVIPRKQKAWIKERVPLEIHLRYEFVGRPPVINFGGIKYYWESPLSNSYSYNYYVVLDKSYNKVGWICKKEFEHLMGGYNRDCVIFVYYPSVASMPIAHKNVSNICSVTKCILQRITGNIIQSNCGRVITKSILEENFKY
jgi:hypothetical protein